MDFSGKEYIRLLGCVEITCTIFTKICYIQVKILCLLYHIHTTEIIVFQVEQVSCGAIHDSTHCSTSKRTAEAEGKRNVKNVHHHHLWDSAFRIICRPYIPITLYPRYTRTTHFLCLIKPPPMYCIVHVWILKPRYCDNTIKRPNFEATILW